MTIPSLRRISDLSLSDEVLRDRVRKGLDSYSLDLCKECPRAVWFTAFFDGTGNNYQMDGNGSLDVSKTKYSNIAKLWQFAHAPDNDPYPRTARRYIEGVGTPCAKVGDSGEGWDKASGMAFASMGEARIRWMLQELNKFVTGHMPFVSQINLAVFGFSRGATQARAFVRMLNEKLAEESEGALWWKEKNINNYRPKLLVYFMGLFDTVASTGWGGSRSEDSLSGDLIPILNKLPLAPSINPAGSVLRAINKGGHAAWANDLRIPRHVMECVHYVAMHEVREKFPSDSTREDGNLQRNCREIYYPGVHSDVGGGYARITQEGRTNELANVPLNNMFIAAWMAGVPFKHPDEVMQSAGGLFEISSDLKDLWYAYMGVGPSPASDDLESNVVWHMNRYYQWRASRRRRLRDGRLRPSGGVDKFMAITDKEWDEDIVKIAKSNTGLLRWPTSDQENSIFEAYQGHWMELLESTSRLKFDRFFDRYVHDSIAGFKQQMAEKHLGVIEMSRWSVNRKYFMGKRERDGKYLYWRYEGNDSAQAGTKVSLLQNSNSQQKAPSTGKA